MVAAIAKFLGIKELFVKIGIGVFTLLALGFAVWGAVSWYQGQIDDAFDRGVKSAHLQVDNRSSQITTKQNNSAAVIKDEANAKVITVVRAATDLRVRGPGRASCPASSDAGTGGSQPAIAETGDPVGSVHPSGGPELSTVRWDDFVTLLEQHDRLLIEAEAWRKDYQVRGQIIAEERQEFEKQK